MLAAAVLAATTPALPAEAQTVYIDDSLTAQEMLLRAEALREEQRVDDAVALLQRLVDENAGKLLLAGDGVYRDVRLQVRQTLLNDPELLAAYRQVSRAEAQRELAEAMDDGASIEALEAVLASYAPTEAGLDAALLVAGLYLERADAPAALAALNEVAEHPDLAARAARYRELSATAWLLAGNAERAEAHVAALRDMGDAAALERVGRIEPAPPASPDAEDPSQVITEPAWADKPLWSRRIDAELTERVDDEFEAMRRLVTNPGADLAMIGIPAVSDHRLLLNTGRTLLAFDRDAGRELWRLEHEDQLDEVLRQRIIRVQGDTRGVATQGRTAYAVLGYMPMGPIRLPGRVIEMSTELVALDATTGRPRWSLTPADVDAALDSSSFFGTPVAASGRVYVLAARMQRSGSRDVFLVAVEAYSGKPLWRRHIAGARTGRRVTGVSEPGMLVVGSGIYVSDPMGAVACIDGRTGLARWVRVFDQQDADPRRGGRRGASHAAVGGAPVMLRGGLFVACGPDPRPWLILDPETGQTHDVLDDDGLPGAGQFVGIEGDLIAIGARTARYDGLDLKPRWSLPLDVTNSALAVGHAAVAGDALAFAAGDHVYVIDAGAGEVRQRVPWGGPANLWLGDNRLYAVGAGEASALLTWSDAHESLTRRARSDPTDPGPGIGLAHLALTTRLPEDVDPATQVLAGVDLALDALRARDRGQAETQTGMTDGFGDLLELTRTGTAGPKLRSEIFQRLATVTMSAVDEVAYHLALGSFLSEPKVARFADAAEHYQAVIADPVLSRQAYVDGGYRRQAGIEAQRLLERLVGQQGRSVYGQFDALARAQLEELTLLGADARAFMDLARRYPLATSAGRAHLEAASRLSGAEDASRAGDAIGQYRLAFQRAAGEQVRAEAAGGLASFYIRLNQHQKADRWLRQVRRADPVLMPLRRGQPISIDAWLAQIRERPDAPQLPRLGSTLVSPLPVAGRLVPLAATGETSPVGRDRFLVRDGDRLRMHAGAGAETVWDIETPASDLVVLAIGSDQVVLWSDTAKTLVAINGQTGKRSWPDRHGPAVLEEVTEADRIGAEEAGGDPALHLMEGPRVRTFLPAPQDELGPDVVLAGANETVVAMADHTGRVVAIDRYTGEVLWRLRSPMDRVHEMHVTSEAVVLTGWNTMAQGKAGHVVVIDPGTGRLRTPVLYFDARPPQWVGTSESVLVVAGQSDVEAHRLDHGGMLWRMSLANTMLTDRGAASEEAILISDRTGVVHVIEPLTGRAMRRMIVDDRNRAAPADIRVDRRGLLLMSGTSLAALSADGTTRWTDAILAADYQLMRQLPARDHVAVLAHSLAAQPGKPAGAMDQMIYLLNRDTGRLVGEYSLPAVEHVVPPSQALLIDGAVVLGDGDRTWVVPAVDTAQ